MYAWADGVASTIASNGLVGVALESGTEQEEKLSSVYLKYKYGEEEGKWQ